MGLESYEIFEVVGVGGFGTVYRARQSFTQRIVAVKVLDRLGRLDEEDLERFKRECRATAALDHPNVVGVFEANIGPNGIPYLVLAFMAGGSLAERVPMDVTEALRIIAQAAMGLAAAHRAGVLHRDIKPHNLLLSAEGEVKLGDFGIARLDPRTSGSLRTTDGRLIGSLPYMAPELLDSQPASASTDVYALGATLLELVSGVPPYCSPDNPNAGPSLHSILDPDTSPIPQCMSDGLRTLLSRALSHDPTRRPTSAAEFALEASSLASSTSAGAATTEAFPLPRRRVADAPTRRMTRTAVIGDGTPTDLHSDWDSKEQDIEQVLWRRAISGDDAAAAELRALLVNSGRELEAFRYFKAGSERGAPWAMVNLGVLLSSAGRLAEAEEWYRAGAGAGHPDAMYRLAMLLSESDQGEEGRQWFSTAAEAGHTGAVVQLALSLQESGQVEEAARWFRTAAEHLGIQMAETDLGEEARRLLQTASESKDPQDLCNLGAVLDGIGRVNEAELRYAEAELCFMASAEAGNTAAMINLGRLHAGAGRVDVALRWYMSAVEHGDSRAMAPLGLLLADAGRLYEAYHFLTAAAESGDTTAMSRLGAILEEAGRIEEAIRWYRSAVEAE